MNGHIDQETFEHLIRELVSARLKTMAYEDTRDLPLGERERAEAMMCDQADALVDEIARVGLDGMETTIGGKSITDIIGGSSGEAGDA